MSKLLLTLSLLLFTVPALSATPTLKENMKELGGLFKEIGKTVSDRTHNEANAKSAARMNAIFVVVKTQVPDSLSTLPPGERAAAIAEFQSMITTIAASAQQLHDAFVANDNRAAADLVNSMNLGKRSGHDKFDK